MKEISTELIKLRKIPLIGITVVIRNQVLGIESGSIKKVGTDGVELYPKERTTETEAQIIEKSSGVSVSLPADEKRLSSKVTKTTYSDKPKIQGWVYLGTYSATSQ